jgi:hypothetical protein
MQQHKYSMSFTTGNLFHRESVQLAELYLKCQDWSAVREMVFAENLLQTRTRSTARRLYNEIASRLKRLDIVELQFLVQATHQDVGYLLWLAVCRRYQFIADFAAEVLRERYLDLKIDLPAGEFETFFDRKAEWSTELEAIRPTTRTKLRQVLFQLLREAGLLTKENIIIAATPSTELGEVIGREDRQDISHLPIFPSDLRRAEK